VCRQRFAAIRALGACDAPPRASGKLNFHWATIFLPAGIVEYVVVHELAHLVEANHTPEFWLRVERTLPDDKQRRQWLAALSAGSAC
jgi:predicted metal-dependent hydrolase